MKTFFTTLLVTFSVFFMHAQEWQTSLVSAKEIAAKENKKIILVFQGSDWCAPCIKLDRKIWQSSDFKTYAKDHFVMLKADFPRRRKNKLPKEQEQKNNALAAKYNPNGHFPLVVVLNKKGEVLGKIGYKNVKPTAYIKLLNAL